MSYLCTNQVSLKNFGNNFEKVTERLKEASLAEAKSCRRSVIYLNSSQVNKQTIARNILPKMASAAGWNANACRAWRGAGGAKPCRKFEIYRNSLTKNWSCIATPW